MPADAITAPFQPRDRVRHTREVWSATVERVRQLDDGVWMVVLDATPLGSSLNDVTFDARWLDHDVPALVDEVRRLRQVEQYAREVMDALEQHGPSIVAHLLDTDDNSGERLRRALNGDAA